MDPVDWSGLTYLLIAGVIAVGVDVLRRYVNRPTKDEEEEDEGTATVPEAVTDPHAKLNSVIILLVVLLVIVGTFAVIVAFYVDRSGQRRDVISGPSPQEVLTALPGVGAPSTTADGEIEVLAEKCNLLEETVTIAGSISWQVSDDENLGTILTTSEFVESREPGCDTTIFINPVPLEVKARTEQIAERTGEDFVVWAVRGSERVIGQPRTYQEAAWFTEEFRVYVEAPMEQ